MSILSCVCLSSILVDSITYAFIKTKIALYFKTIKRISILFFFHFSEEDKTSVEKEDFIFLLA
jgi:hypothetical protein